MANVDTPDDQIMAVNYGDFELDDWSAKHQISLSELATRLNAKQHFDNRGRQIWIDGFEEVALQWNTGAAGGGTATRVTTNAWRGAASVLLNTPAVAGAYIRLDKLFYSPETGRYAAEITWASDTNTFTRLNLELFYYDGVNYWHGLVGLSGVNARWWYITLLGVYVYFTPPVNQDNNIHYWHKMKVVIDIDNHVYARCLFDGNEVPMTTIPLATGLSGLSPRIMARITLNGGAGGAYNAYIDDFILTHLEP